MNEKKNPNPELNDEKLDEVAGGGDGGLSFLLGQWQYALAGNILAMRPGFLVCARGEYGKRRRSLEAFLLPGMQAKIR